MISSQLRYDILKGNRELDDKRTYSRPRGDSATARREVRDKSLKNFGFLCQFLLHMCLAHIKKYLGSLCVLVQCFDRPIQQILHVAAVLSVYFGVLEAFKIFSRSKCCIMGRWLVD